MIINAFSFLTKKNNSRRIIICSYGKCDGMKRYWDENDRIKKTAGNDMIILLDQWKKKHKKLRIYRTCLLAVMMAGIIALSGTGYLYFYNQIPSIIRIRVGVEQALDLGVPATGEVVSVSEQGISNIPRDAVTIDLNKPITVIAESLDLYQLQVKLFGFLPFKQVEIEVIEDQELIPVGTTIGIYVKTDGILVVGVGEFVSTDGVTISPAKYIMNTGDYITHMNGVEVNDKDEFIRMIESTEGEEIILTIRRDGQTMDVEVKPQKNQSGAYKIGIWIRDNAQGVGTMTYIDEEGNFGALGHGINDVDTSTLMEIEDGTLYLTEIISITKGVSGTPGEMTGMIVYSEERILGDIRENSTEGIYGICNENALRLSTEQAIPIALKQEIQIGPAQIYCNVDGKSKYYDIEITAVRLNHDNVNRGIELRITDPELLDITGGIVQGMSGAPIIQNEKFVGAVTHVLVQDAAKGYGIFIENMLSH